MGVIQIIVVYRKAHSTLTHSFMITCLCICC